MRRRPEPAGRLLFELRGSTRFSPPRAVKFFARAVLDPAAPGRVLVPDAGRQAASAAFALRLVRTASLN